MNPIATQLETFIDGYIPALNKISEEDFNYKSSPVKWSRKEITGHLVDSAHNNIRRLIVCQYEENPTIIYNQDQWVSLNNYQQQASNQIIQLWHSINKQLVAILKNISTETANRKCQGVYTIEWLAQDYIKHLQHHMHQVLDLEPIAYP